MFNFGKSKRLEKELAALREEIGQIKLFRLLRHGLLEFPRCDQPFQVIDIHTVIVNDFLFFTDMAFNVGIFSGNVFGQRFITFGQGLLNIITVFGQFVFFADEFILRHFLFSH